MSIEVLKFSASWCTPCKLLSATLKDVEGVKEIDIDQNSSIWCKKCSYISLSTGW